MRFQTSPETGFAGAGVPGVRPSRTARRPPQTRQPLANEGSPATLPSCVFLLYSTAAGLLGASSCRNSSFLWLHLVSGPRCRGLSWGGLASGLAVADQPFAASWWRDVSREDAASLEVGRQPSLVLPSANVPSVQMSWQGCSFLRRADPGSPQKRDSGLYL